MSRRPRVKAAEVIVLPERCASYAESRCARSGGARAWRPGPGRSTWRSSRPSSTRRPRRTRWRSSTGRGVIAHLRQAAPRPRWRAAPTGQDGGRPAPAGHRGGAVRRPPASTSTTPTPSLGTGGPARRPRGAVERLARRVRGPPPSQRRCGPPSWAAFPSCARPGTASRPSTTAPATCSNSRTARTDRSCWSETCAADASPCS